MTVIALFTKYLGGRVAPEEDVKFAGFLFVCKG
jgi:hypothetical protein